jgi:hypothetical protein
MKMRKRILAGFGLLFVSAFMTQLATAASSNARKPARAPVAVNQQFRDANGSADLPQGHRLPTSGSKSCDSYSCYEN